MVPVDLSKTIDLDEEMRVTNPADSSVNSKYKLLWPSKGVEKKKN